MVRRLKELSSFEKDVILLELKLVLILILPCVIELASEEFFNRFKII